MSAGAYINRIRVQTQARNVKVQYPGGRATNFNELFASCASNPNFTTLNYQEINLCCKLSNQVIPFPPAPSCGPPASNSILYGGNSSPNNNCILDGGFSGSSYTPILDGGNSL